MSVGQYQHFGHRTSHDRTVVYGTHHVAYYEWWRCDFDRLGDHDRILFEGERRIGRIRRSRVVERI